MNGIDLLDSTSNAAIVKLEERQYPGLLLQGDTLKVILDDLSELRDELAVNEVEAATEIASELHDRFNELLRHYESVLSKNGLSFPYIGSVSDNNNADTHKT